MILMERVFLDQMGQLTFSTMNCACVEKNSCVYRGQSLDKNWRLL